MSQVESFYPLSPLQQGMLYHSLSAPESGVYVEQLSCRISGGLRPDAFRTAWRQTVAHYAILRTAFVWEGVKDPVQVVFSSVELPWDEQDWSGLAPDAQEQRLQAYLDADRRRGFALAEAPLLRLALLRTGPDSCHFVWTHHHMLLDGWSLPLLISSVLARYEALCRGEQPRLPPSRPFREYIAWIWQQSPARAEAFWRAELAGRTAPTPLWESRPAGQAAPRLGAAERSLAPEVSARLQALAREARLTLSTLIQGAWAILLGCYSGEPEALFGITVSGRPPQLPGVEQMVGMFINTLPLRVPLGPCQTLADWLERLHQRQTAMREYEHCSLIDIQGWSEVPRSLPLFESIVVFENYPVESALGSSAAPSQSDADAIRVSDVHVFEQTNYALTLVSGPGAQIVLKLLYDQNRFDAERIERMLTHLAGVLEQFAGGLGQRLGAITVPAADERARLLRQWGLGTAAPAPDECVQALVERWAEQTPGAPALADSRETLSYAELNRRANQLAHHLRGAGVGPEVCVGVLLDRSAELVVALLAVLKAGGAYLPIDPRYPRERIGAMLADSGAPLLITRADLADLAPDQPAPRVYLDRDAGLLEAQSRANPPALATQANLAYLIYTSGSTGRPKGVQVEHRSLANLVAWHWRAYEIGPEDRATQVASPAFDAMVWEIWPYLTAGASVHIPDATTYAMPEALRDWLIQKRISVSFLPTPLAEQLLALRWPASAPLRLLLTGGDRLQRLPAPGLPFRLINNYGPTEGTVVTTAAEVPPGADAAPPIGRPIDNGEVYVLDDALRPVPEGLPGQLYVGGRNLARGYHGRPDLTAERFVPHPLSAQPGARLYATGDRVCFLPDGALAFLGRTDQQVKIRGVRIELGEIEATLLRHPRVRAAVVVARDDQSEPYLAAYAVADHTVAIHDLLAHLRASLPETMVPAALMTLPSLPLDQHGKLDRRALPPPSQASVRQRQPFVPPRDNLECELVLIWEEVLGIHPIGVKDSFYDLGGHSLRALHLVSEVTRRIDETCPINALIRSVTIEEMGRVLREHTGGQSWSPLMPLKASGQKRPFFCVHSLPGIAWNFIGLSRYTDEDRPFYGLQARGLEPGQQPHGSVEEMATCYIEAIRAAQPEGPYYIGGYSFGGYIAYEIAQQLQRQGQQVGLLVIFDTALMDTANIPEEVTQDNTVLMEVVINLEHLAGTKLNIDFELIRSLTSDQQLELMRMGLSSINIELSDAAMGLLRGFDVVAKASQGALRHYRLQPYDGQVAMIRAELRDERPDLGDEYAAVTGDQTLGWQQHVTDLIKVRSVSCSHIRMMFEPAVRDVGAQLRACLDEADAALGA